MSPLSAIQAFAPELTPSPLAKAGAQPLAPAGIPFSELNELGSIAGSPLSPTNGRPVEFGSLLGSMVSDVNAKQSVAGEAVKGLISGQGVPLHQAVIAMEEANVSFQLMVEVRNRMLDAYQELMRMQI